MMPVMVRFQDNARLALAFEGAKICLNQDSTSRGDYSNVESQTSEDSCYVPLQLVICRLGV